MTVKELIERLEEVDQDKDVVIYDGESLKRTTELIEGYFSVEII